jgi:hypothetical protein
MRIGLYKPADRTLELIINLQLHLKSARPLWRVQILGEDDSSDIMIYPTVVRYGTFPLPHVMDESLLVAEMVRREEELVPYSRRCEALQHQVLRGLLAESIACVMPGSALFVAYFDNHWGDYNSSTLWVVCPSSIADLTLLSSIDYSLGDKFLVKEDGDFGHHVCPGAPLWIRQWIFPRTGIPAQLQFCLLDIDGSTKIIEFDGHPKHSVKMQPL